MSESEPVFLGIMSWADDEQMKLYVQPEFDAELRAVLDEAGIRHSIGMEFSAGWDHAIAVLSLAGGTAPFWLALGKVLTAWLSRHDKKVVEVDGKRINLSGFSAKDAEQLIDAIRAERAEQDRRWSTAPELADRGEDTREGSGNQPNQG